MVVLLIIVFVVAFIAFAVSDTRKAQRLREEYPPGWYRIKGFDKAHYFGNTGGGLSICGHVRVPIKAIQQMSPMYNEYPVCEHCKSIKEQL
jgi:hypothetical protein